MLVLNKIKKKIDGMAELNWREQMGKKSTLSFYREHKAFYGCRETPYSNSKASGLFADCRAGMLNTNVMKAKYNENVDTKCRVCQEDEETIEHVVLKCKDLGIRKTNLNEALGFSDKCMRPTEINDTKRRLAKWISHRQ